MKYCSCEGYCGFHFQEGSLLGCSYEGFCDYQMPRDSRPVAPLCSHEFEVVGHDSSGQTNCGAKTKFRCRKCLEVRWELD
jgi:hypothetical protein